MRPSGHLSSAIIVWILVSLFTHQVYFVNFCSFLIGTVFLDIDFLGKLFFHQKNHRRYITHYPLFWLIIGVLSYLFSLSELFWFSCGALTHLLTDFIDWGIPLAPTSSAELLPHILVLQLDTTNEKVFSRIYWSNNSMKRLEIIFFIFAVIGAFLLPEIFLILFLILGCIVYPLSLWDYHRGKSSIITQ